jgi:sec-independent protein translocase protein TatA
MSRTVYNEKYSCMEVMMLGLGFPELAIILVIALVVFGAGKLPNVMGSMGKGLREFKKAVNDPVSDKMLVSDNKSRLVEEETK